jgi:hypothetical protein
LIEDEDFTDDPAARVISDGPNGGERERNSS